MKGSNSKTKSNDKIKDRNNEEVESQVEKSAGLECKCESCRKTAKSYITEDAIKCDLCGNWVVGHGECTRFEGK